MKRVFLEEAIDRMVRERGLCGPYALGSYHCDLCGHVGETITPIWTDGHPLSYSLRCFNCEQPCASFLALNDEAKDAG